MQDGFGAVCVMGKCQTIAIIENNIYTEHWFSAFGKQLYRGKLPLVCGRHEAVCITYTPHRWARGVAVHGANHTATSMGSPQSCQVLAFHLKKLPMFKKEYENKVHFCMETSALTHCGGYKMQLPISHYAFATVLFASTNAGCCHQNVYVQILHISVLNWFFF